MSLVKTPQLNAASQNGACQRLHGTTT